MASKLTDYELTKKLLQKGEVDELKLRLDKLNMVHRKMMTMTINLEEAVWVREMGVQVHRDHQKPLTRNGSNSS